MILNMMYQNIFKIFVMLNMYGENLKTKNCQKKKKNFRYKMDCFKKKKLQMNLLNRKKYYQEVIFAPFLKKIKLICYLWMI